MMSGVTRSGGEKGKKRSPAGITLHRGRFVDDRVEAGTDTGAPALVFRMGFQAGAGPTTRTGATPAGFTL